MILLDGKKVSEKILLQTKEKVDKIKLFDGTVPKLAVIMVGSDNSSKVYVKNKSKACKKVGIDFIEYLLEENTKMDELLSLIDNLNNDKTVSAILLQSPIPENLDITLAFNKIDPKKDVDGFNPQNVGKLQIGEPLFIPCTPKGIVKLLEEYNIDLSGKNVVVIGRSNIVGKPLLSYMLNKNATVTIAHSKTKNLKEITKNMDIIVSCVGKEKLIKEDMVKENAIVIDVGINKNKAGKLVGDVDFENVLNKASYITPVPGGVGPMTIAMLMQNVVKAYELNKKI